MDLQVLHVLGAQADNERTILDYLNEDCWKAVLDYVPVKDILRTEQTSRHWQKVMLTYLSYVKINVNKRWQDSDKINHNSFLVFTINCYPSFKLWTYKLGASVIYFESYSFDIDDGIEILGKNCPNLEVLKLFKLKNKLPPNSAEGHFHHLKQICLDYCKVLTDDCISQFLTSNALEELKILTNVKMTGKCLTNLKTTKLKSLSLRSCWALEFPPLLSLADRLGNLTKLALARACSEIRDQVHLLLDKMPKLEYLTILIDGVDKLTNSNVFFDAVCRLTNLKHLSSNFYTWDQHLEALTEHCTDLEVLKLLCWHVTGRGAAAVCRVGSRLTHLDLAYSHVNDSDVLGIVCACPNLMWLRLTTCKLQHAVSWAAAARRRQGASARLRVVIEECYGLEHKEDEVEDVLELCLRDDLRDSDGVEDLY